MSNIADAFPPRRSDDGNIEVRWDVYEVRMSHWVLEPAVVRLRDEHEVASLDGTGWDGGGVAPTFPRRDQVELHLRRYPEGGRTVDVGIDVEQETWWFVDDPGSPRPTGTLVAELEHAFDRHVEKTTPDYLAQGVCPYCKTQLYPRKSLFRRRPDRNVQCLVCERWWELPV